MSEIDKDYKKVKQGVFALILVCVFVFWWDWCREKPIRFIYSAIIIVILNLYAK